MRFLIVGAIVLAPSLALADKASWYGEPQRVACGGGRFNPSGLTAAHRTLPCGAKVVVTNLRNGKSVSVVINDRGPAKWTGRNIDLSRGAASVIGMIAAGVVPVSIKRR